MTAQSLTSPDNLQALTRYLRLADYIAAAQLYLKENFLLRGPLKREHLKARLLGHWGTVPGLNFIWACSNLALKKHNREALFVAGPGHGYPALLANLYIEGSLGDFYPEYKHSASAFANLIKKFSWPGGFPSHANPETPGVILEGGELGYSLATSFGAVFDNPDLTAICVVGDGEAETGPIAAAWHSNKFLNPKTSGAVLPIVHINKFKISGPTIFGSMNDDELRNLFVGYGYDPIIVGGEFLYEPMLEALDSAFIKINKIQSDARTGQNLLSPKWPVILLQSPKGWGGVKSLGGKAIEGTFKSHGIPLENVHTDDSEFAALEAWLKSYAVHELVDENFDIAGDIKSIIPSKRIGMSKHAIGGEMRTDLILPDLFSHATNISERATCVQSNTEVLSMYLKEVIEKNPNNFRIMSPDETESNKLHHLFDVTQRAYMWPVPDGSENIGPDGRVMEILSEHTLQGWMEGYILTGRHSVFVSYEAFMMIVASMVDQYQKFLTQSQSVKWRKPLPGMTFVLTSTSWRQDHNGFSHQNPGFISTVLNNQSDMVSVYFPADANTLIATIDKCLSSTNTINVIVADKRGLPQYLNIHEAKRQMATGIERWSWAGNEDVDPDVIFASCGDHSTYESLAAIEILKQIAPYLRTRFINVAALSCNALGLSNSGFDHTKFTHLFTADRDIIFNYHGYPQDIRSLLYQHPEDLRFKIFGYIERGTTTTPFDMKVKNRCSRFHLGIEAVKSAAKVNPEVRKNIKTLLAYFETMLLKHKLSIEENGTDMPEIETFKFYCN